MSSHQQLTPTATSQRFNDEQDKIRALKAELDRCRQENEKLRQLIPPSPGVKIISTSATIDSTVDNNMPVSTASVRITDRERKLLDEINSLREVMDDIKSIL